MLIRHFPHSHNALPSFLLKNFLSVSLTCTKEILLAEKQACFLLLSHRPIPPVTRNLACRRPWYSSMDKCKFMSFLLLRGITPGLWLPKADNVCVGALFWFATKNKTPVINHFSALAWQIIDSNPWKAKHTVGRRFLGSIDPKSDCTWRAVWFWVYTAQESRI